MSGVSPVMMAGKQSAALLGASLGIAFDEPRLQGSFDYCQEVARKHARNFYYGMKLTPEPKRSAMYAIYAWNRAADDLADEPDTSSNGGTNARSGLPNEAQIKTDQLEQFRAHTRLALDPEAPLEIDAHGRFGRMWPAVACTLRSFSIPGAYLDHMVDGQVLDQTKTRYETFEDLYDYCYKVASVVGLTCIEIWGYDGDAETRKLAEYRGIGLQLTNILRDLQEDAQRDRVYLPASVLARHGYDTQSFLDQLKRRQPDGRFERLILNLTDCARGYYQRSEALETRLEPKCRSACWAIMYIYRQLLERMANRPGDVLTKRVRLSSLQKAWIALRAARSNSIANRASHKTRNGSTNKHAGKGL
jgi:phytoene synthase